MSANKMMKNVQISLITMLVLESAMFGMAGKRVRFDHL